MVPTVLPAFPSERCQAWLRSVGPPAGTWLAGAALMVALDGWLDLANLAMLLVLTAAVAALWLPAWAGALVSALAVAAFNWRFVPPRYTLAVDLQQDALLLMTMLGVSWIVSALVVRQRRLADAARDLAGRESRLRAWGDTLRDAADPAAQAGTLQAALAEATGLPVALHVLQRLGVTPDDASALKLGDADADQRAGLALCRHDGRPMGPGTGRHEEQPDLYLPLRARHATLGAAVVRGWGSRAAAPALTAHLQALCDQMGGALQRSLIARDEQRAREAAEWQATRNALLAAISHDYRTPLATILGAASALHEQGSRMEAPQRARLAASIVEEATRLSRLTENTLQLARLDAPQVELRADWESAEEIVGAALRQARRAPGGERVRARLEPELPLLWCDAILVSQLLQNLVDNALRYSPAEEPVEIVVRRVGSDAVLAVCDRGPGIAPAWRARVFDAFQRGEGPSAIAATATGRQGAGVGLAVCRAIARAHGGELGLRPRKRGGCSFEFRLPLRDAPPPPPTAAPS